MVKRPSIAPIHIIKTGQDCPERRRANQRIFLDGKSGLSEPERDGYKSLHVSLMSKRHGGGCPLLQWLQANIERS